MAKHRSKKTVVYHNHNTDNWTNDTKEQLSLALGSDGHQARQEQLQNSDPTSDLNMEKVADMQFAIGEKRKSEKLSHEVSTDFTSAFLKGTKSPSVLIHAKRMGQRDYAIQTARIASEGLGRDVSVSEIEARANSSTMQVEAATTVLKQYKAELDKRETPSVDLDGDGDVDQDDVVITPGMRAMRRFV